MVLRETRRLATPASERALPGAHMARPSPPRVWFVTGAARGLGRAFAAAALEAGDAVVATARRAEALADLAGPHAERALVLPLDVTDRAAVFAAVARAVQAFGHLDVVVNNAGYGLVGATEEIGEAEARAQLDTNLFGALWVTQAVLPHLRGRGSGHIVQISSVGGVGSMATFGLYNAGKWALEGFSEALAAEVAPFGIRVTIAELGGFATDWAWASMRFATPAPAYDPLRASLFGSPRVPWDMSQQAADTSADPASAARALLAHVDRADGPLRLLIGEDAPGHVRAALERRRDDYRRDERFEWPA
ncbi:short-chain dehydrogenase/reductase SDR [Anaeromyxobacter sp. Fw109-5]|nr:short-chain dehydrogenase/reductase SDR [Anaeromyxobacter sp. Fw109-5]